jgi:phage shock protein A
MSKPEEFCRRALECRRRANAVGADDKQAWLKLAEDWDKLARSEDLLEEHWKDLQAKRSILDKRNKPRSAA